MKILSTFLMKNLRKLHLVAHTYSSALMYAQTLCSVGSEANARTSGDLAGWWERWVDSAAVGHA